MNKITAFPLHLPSTQNSRASRRNGILLTSYSEEPTF